MHIIGKVISAEGIEETAVYEWSLSTHNLCCTVIIRLWEYATIIEWSLYVHIQMVHNECQGSE